MIFSQNSNNCETAQRLLWLDSLKGILILLVILGHSIQCVLLEDCDNSHVWNAIYSFHMAAFVALSGWISYNTKPINFGKSVIRRFNQLLVPYLLWSFIRCFVSFEHTTISFINIILRPESYFWFLWVLFWICVLFSFCRLLSSCLRIDEMYPILFSCALLFCLMLLFNIRVFGFQLIAYYFIFYTIGYAIRRFSLFNCNNFILIALIIIWSFLAWSWKMHSLPSWVPSINHIPVIILQYLYRGLTALIAIIILLNLSPRWLNKNNKMNTIFSKLGFTSLGIYVVHIFLIDFLYRSFLLFNPTINSTIVIILIFSTALVLSVFLVKLLLKNKYSARLLLGKI